MPLVDWNATAAWIAILVTLAITIITPALTSFLNNRFQLHLKKMELQESAENELFSKKLETYEGALRTIGNCIHYYSPDNRAIFGEYLYKLYLYLPEEHWPVLDSLVKDFEEDAREQIWEDFLALSKILSRELNTSERLVKLKEKRKIH